MSKSLFCCLVSLSIAAWSAPARGLSGDEVLVVANARSADSVQLAELYAKLRGIDANQIVLINSRPLYAITREDYDTQIRDVLRKELIDRKLAPKIRCLALMWGVPVRVMGPARQNTPASKTGSAYNAAASKAHYRLVVAYRLLSTVCKEFPAPKTTTFKPIGNLFTGPIPLPKPPLDEFKTLKKNTNTMLARKWLELGRITDAAKENIAARQLMALHLEIHGLNGLILFIETEKPPGAPDPTNLKNLVKQVNIQLDQLATAPDQPETVAKRLRLLNVIGGARHVYSYAVDKAGNPPETTQANKKLSPMSFKSSDASVDSELALLWWPSYPLAGPMMNTLNWRNASNLRGALNGKPAPPTLMTARLDGPTSRDAERALRTAVATEAKGLRGTFYIDAGGKVPEYDKKLVGLHAILKRYTKLPTFLDQQKQVFQPGACPEAALYVGWYSLRKYVPAFTWTPGAVGWHVASYEAQHLRDPASKEWCVKMIQNGVAATIGAVHEPRLDAFPDPQEFFPLLLTGRYTLAECYWRTTPMTSWRMTLIGDPLYNPFRVNPQMKVESLPKGLAPPAANSYRR